MAKKPATAKKPVKKWTKKKTDGKDAADRANKYLEQSVEKMADVFIDAARSGYEEWNPSVLKGFRSPVNPVTKTVYSPLNAMLLNNFLKSNDLSTTTFITRNEATKRFGADSLIDPDGKKVGNAWPLQAFKVSLYEYEKDSKGADKLSVDGKKSYKRDSDGKAVKGAFFARKFSSPLVSVEMINSPDVPKEWLERPMAAQPDDQFLRKLITFLSEEVSVVPVVRDATVSGSSCNANSITMAPVGEYRSTLAELSSILHEMLHVSGYRDYATGELVKERQSLAEYSNKNRVARATEELTVQVAMQSIISGLNIESMDEVAFKDAMDNHEVYNCSWGRSFFNTPEGGSTFKQNLKAVITEANKAFTQVVGRMSLEMRKQPELLSELESTLGKDNLISMKIAALDEQENRIVNKPKMEG